MQIDAEGISSYRVIPKSGRMREDEARDNSKWIFYIEVVYETVYY